MYYILIITLLILVVFYYTKLYNTKSFFDNLPHCTLQNAYNSATTGDVILFRWNYVNPLHEIVSSFTHIGIVIELNGRKYILETHLKGDTNHMGFDNNDGVNIYDLYSRIKMYKGENFILKMNPKYYNKIKIDDNITNYRQIPFKNEYIQHFSGVCIPKKICNDCFSNVPGDSMFCSQFIGHILQQYSILEESFDINCLTPHDFVNIKNNDGNIYETLYKIIKS